MRLFRISNVAALVAVSTMTLGLAACGSSTEAASDATTTTVPATADHNSADIVFAQNMIPHHVGAIEMSALATTRASSAEVKTLATRIQQAQQPEIDTMNQWLDEWGVVNTSGDAHSGHNSDSEEMTASMPGMMSAEELDSLEALNGLAFDRIFLQKMIEHHEGAIEMAQKETADGKDADAKALAETIISTQQDEIADMEELLSTLE